MNLSGKIFQPELYNYNDYKLWEGDWELFYGYPQAMSPSAKRSHQQFAAKFCRLFGNLLEKNNKNCNCEVFFELDWIINDNTVVRPDGMIVCGNFTDDFLNFPPTLILEVSSDSTRMKDRNTKYTLYEMYGVKYYIIADTEKTSVEVFELTDNKYKQTETTHFVLTKDCSIPLDVFNLWG